MPKADHTLLGRTSKRPTLFRQIATRLALFTLVFALLDIAIVITTYSRQPQSLAEELLTMEAAKASNSGAAETNLLAGPPGASRWFASYLASDSVPAPSASVHQSPVKGDLMDWTRREKLAEGYRISGVRTVTIDGERKWLFMQFEGSGIRPYVPVIANELLQHVALPLVPLSLLMLLFNVLAVRRVLAPLREAETQVDQLDPENMSLRIAEPSQPREVATLVSAVNRALARLELAMGTLRSFTANAAHELRTPLSIMQLSLAELPQGEQRQQLLRDNAQMSRLVNQLLDLAQADASTLDLGDRIDLAEIAQRAVSQLAPLALGKGQDISFEDFGNAKIHGHDEAIYRVLRNLIENAIYHGSGNKPIEVRAGPGPQVSIRDHGPGICEEDIPFIFDRFWRKNRQNQEGSGLGLGIVHRLVEVHGGTIELETPPDGGAQFTVSFPGPIKSNS
ncbi:HAMP domain-containing sensor histidine kinase [Citromicrobium bathyomarinum]